MSSIIANPIFFLSLSALLIGTGGLVKIDQYENNTLRNLNNSYSQMFLTKETQDKLNLETDTWFNYWIKDKQYSRKVVSIERRDNNKYEVILSTSDDISVVSFIKYKIGRSSLIKEIFV